LPGRWREAPEGAIDNPHIDRSNSLQPHKLLAMYHTMVMARAITRRVWVLQRRDVLPIYGEVARRAGGAEAVQVAAATALRGGVDWVVPHHRDLALCLALGVSPLDVMMSVLGHASDLSSRQARIVTTSGLAGRHLPHAAGIAYGMAAESIDGSDFNVALDALNRAVDRARSGEGPTLVHARITALTSRTPRGNFQTQDQLEAASRHDPIERMRRQLHDLGLLDDQGDDKIQRDCITVVEAALKQARSAPMAEPAKAMDNLHGA
jgi:TPP-dependent pyruvate/acetoin dehydrogenase alpha subunit